MGYREYMARGPEAPPAGVSPMVRGLLWAHVAVFLLGLWLGPLFFPLVLSRAGLAQGRFWQPLTYQFLHANLTHLAFNLFGLYMFGPDAERALGGRRFLFLYLFCGVLGGIGFVLLSEGRCIGASGAVYGTLAAFAALYPNRRLSLLLFPFVSFRAWTVVLAYGLIEFGSMLSSPHGGIAHSAHLVGGLAGWIYARALVAGPAGGVAGFGRRAGRAPPREPPAPPSAEVNRILDKIAARGLHSLSSRERERLEQASRNRMPRG